MKAAERFQLGSLSKWLDAISQRQQQVGFANDASLLRTALEEYECMNAALTELAKQKLTEEMDELEADDADYEFAYNELVKIARKACPGP